MAIRVQAVIDAVQNAAEEVIGYINIEVNGVKYTDLCTPVDVCLDDFHSKAEKGKKSSKFVIAFMANYTTISKTGNSDTDLVRFVDDLGRNCNLHIKWQNMHTCLMGNSDLGTNDLIKVFLEKSAEALYDSEPSFQRINSLTRILPLLTS